LISARIILGDSLTITDTRYGIVEGRTSAEIYIVCRVYNLGKKSLSMKLYVDPEAHRGRDLVFEA